MEHIGLTTICQGPSSLFLPAGIWGFSRAEKADSAIAKDIWRTATLPLLEIMVTSAVMKTASSIQMTT